MRKLSPAAQKRGFACRVILGNACLLARSAGNPACATIITPARPSKKESSHLSLVLKKRGFARGSSFKNGGKGNPARASKIKTSFYQTDGFMIVIKRFSRNKLTCLSNYDINAN